MIAQHRFDKKTLTLALLASVGFGLLQGARLLDVNSGPYSAHPYALVGLSIDGLTFICVAVLSYVGRLDRARPLFWITLAVSSAYAILMAAGSSHPVALVCMQITAGAGWALAILCWMEVFTSYRPLYSLPMIAFSFLLDLLIPPLVNVLLPEGRLLALLIVFSLSMAALFVCLRENEYIAHAMQDAVAPKTSMAEAFSRTKRAVAGTFVFSVVCGFVIELDIFRGLQYAQTNLTSLFSIGIAIMMLVLLLVMKPHRANIDYISPIAALVLVSILLYRSLDFADSYAAGSLMVSFLMAFYVLLWLMFISEAHERKLPAFFLLGLALGVARLSVALGRFVAQTLLERSALDPHVALIGCVWVLVVALSLIFFSYLRYATKLHRHQLDDTPEQAPYRMAAPAPDERAWKELSSTFRLTNREFEVIRDFAAGRTARHIADQLVLSEHTVKTHLRHAYAKMGVHSRQELLDLLEDFTKGTYAESALKA